MVSWYRYQRRNAHPVSHTNLTIAHSVAVGVKCKTRSATLLDASDFVEPVKGLYVGPVDAPPKDRIRLDGDSLLWELDLNLSAQDRYRKSSPEPDVFDRFLRLHHCPDTEILRFAGQNGVLGLCKHGLPLCHVIDPQGAIFENSRLHCTFGLRSRAIVEPLDSWRALSRGASALLTLKQEGYGPAIRPEDYKSTWESALWLCAEVYQHQGPASYLTLIKEPVPEPSNSGLRVLTVANEWLRCSGVSFQLRDGETGRYRFDARLDAFGPNLFGFIAFQLALAVAERTRWAMCANPNCGREIDHPANTVSLSRQRWCARDECQAMAAAVRSKKYQASKRDAMRMHAGGCTIDQIASEMGRSRKIITKWVSPKPAQAR